MNDNEIFIFADVDSEAPVTDSPWGLWLQVDWGVMRLGPVWYQSEDDARREGRRLLAALQGQTEVD